MKNVRRWGRRVAVAVLAFAVRALPLVVGTFALAATAIAPAARAVPLGATVLVDRPTGFGALPFDGVGDTSLTTSALSANGRFVVFSSDSTVLRSGNQLPATHVYRLDLTHGTLVQVDRTSTGGQPTRGSENDQASISGDGNFVGFMTTSPALAPAAGPNNEQFVVKNLTTGKLEIASRSNGAGGAPVADLQGAVLSGDGRHVAFTASSVVHTDTTATGVAGQTDAYLRSLDTNTTHMMSVTSTGAEGGGVRSQPSINFSGDAVGFATTAALVPTDTDTGEDAYVHVMSTDTTLLASFSSTTQTEGADTGFDVAVAGSPAALYVAWDDGLQWLALCNPLCNNAAQRVDHARTGGEDFNNSEEAPFFPNEVSSDLPTRVFWDTSDPLDPADTNNAVDIYGWDIGDNNFNNSIHLMTSGKENQGAFGSSTDPPLASVTAFETDASNLPGANGAVEQVFVRRSGVDTNISQLPGHPLRTDAAGQSFVETLHALSDDGSKVAFESRATAFGAPIESEGPTDQVVVRNVKTGKTRLASVAASGGKGGNGDSFSPSIDAAGDRVVFDSDATNLLPGTDPNGNEDVFMRNLVTGKTTLIDRTAGGGFPISGAFAGQISADGTKAVFESRSVDIPGSPLDDNEHIYEVDIATGNVTLIDRSNGGAAGNDNAEGADLDANGKRVAFVSEATNLGGSSSDSVYVRDLTHPAHPTTTWVSIPQNGKPADDDAGQPSIDRNGQHVAFNEFNSAFGFGMTGGDQVFVRNLVTRRTTLASTGPHGPANREAFGASLSDDGTRVAFASDATNLPGAVAGLDDVFVRDLATRKTVLASPRNGTSSAGDRGADDGSLSGNGACVAFASDSDNLVSGGYSATFEHVFLHAVSSSCPPLPAPVVSHLSLTHKSFAVGSKPTALTAVVHGTTFTFALNEAATTRIAIAQQHNGHVLLTLVRSHTGAGANRVAFSGRYGNKRLASGNYTATVTATNADGKRSQPRSVTFTVVG
jgi:hypothetical protein